MPSRAHVHIAESRVVKSYQLLFNFLFVRSKNFLFTADTSVVVVHIVAGQSIREILGQEARRIILFIMELQLQGPLELVVFYSGIGPG